MTRYRKSQYQTLGGGRWRKARAELLSRGNAYCWRGCGTYLRVDAKRGDPDFMTMGHVMALEDGGAKYDPENIKPECGPCNFSDGARRKNAKAAGKTYTHHPRQSYKSPEWFEAYQVGTPMAFLGCSVAHCAKDMNVKGMCAYHYKRARLGITPVDCPICGTTTERTKYCSDECQREAGARQMRDRYRASQGKPVDPSKPTKPWARTWQPASL